jgi:hypothetical protein
MSKKKICIHLNKNAAKSRLRELKPKKPKKMKSLHKLLKRPRKKSK